MRPNDPLSRGPIVPQREVVRDASAHLTTGSRTVSEAAAGVVRSQIDTIYTNQAAEEANPLVATTAPASAAATTLTPYQQSHATVSSIEPDQWKQYHSAWQDYYQQYYERYYVGQVYQAKAELQAKLPAGSGPQPASPKDAANATFSHDEAVNDLRSKLRGQVEASAKKVKSSRHFMPIMAGLGVIIVFLFLQYNQLLFAPIFAYSRPAGTVDPQNLITDPLVTAAVSDEPRLIIPKFNIDVPVDYTVSTDHDAQMKAMQNGVAYFGIKGADSKPGQLGNTPIAGHSSNDFFESGNYKFIFAPLERMTTGDRIYANYQGVRYTYSVTRTEVVMPNEASKLILPTDKPYLTLITCTPLGTSQKRLLVIAEQISPDPAKAAAAPDTTSGSSATIPGNTPSLLQRLFGSN